MKKKEKKIEEINGFDIVIAFGSSFNVLRTFRNMKSDIPVLGVSIYENEFLPEITLEDFKRLFSMIKNGEYSIERRNRLEAFVDGDILLPLKSVGFRSYWLPRWFLLLRIMARRPY